MASRSHDILPLAVNNYLEMRCNICLFQNPERNIEFSALDAYAHGQKIGKQTVLKSLGASKLK
jgi:hypothetical protein